ncbi:tRNA dihydrouridine(20/20a) synthase DusA [Buchnera aphidicola (Taiwanaphis decaspermi)]|uniref:tRNA dihydrouridine(20/20a) synthase DusA n=1 Tax=Buchnera aphidicola TaxID=9 RepID=UPI0031B885CC
MIKYLDRYLNIYYLKKMKKYDHKFCVAPMLNWTNRHCRYFHRKLTKYAFLYTEMLTTQSIIFGKNKKNIKYKKKYEKPVAIQLGGSNYKHFQICSKLAYDSNFDEININVGCPSKKAQLGNFGIILMKKPEIIIDCLKSMEDTVDLPLTIKTRIGINNTNYNFLQDFIGKISESTKCNTFIIHARNANLSLDKTKKNLTIPKLNYKFVYKIKKNFPNLKIIINGGIKSLKESKKHLSIVDGIMMGRTAYKKPSLLAKIDNFFFKKKKKNIFDVIESMYPYIKKNIKKNNSLSILKPMIGLFHSKPFSSMWKKTVTQKNNNIENIKETIKKIKKLYLEL